MRSKTKIDYRGNYIAGKFVIPSDSQGEWKSICPGDASDVLATLKYSYTAVDLAVEAALKAFDSWKRTTLEERFSLAKRYQEILKRRQDEIAEVIAREVGKPFWEAKTEVAAMANKVDVTIQDSMPLVKEIQIPNIMPNTLGRCEYRPLGVLAVIGPFNFPGHLPNGHIIPGLLTGNTIVFKPSEKTPLVAQLMAECFHEAGFPPGVINVVQGERETGRRLCTHEDVHAILFTGSYEVGTRIKQDTLLQHWKLLALEMGGKNATVVWEDADLLPAVRDTLVSAFWTTGQRCSATSRVLVHEKLYDRFVTEFHTRAKAFTIGHPLSEVFMGALIDASSVDRFLKFQGIAQREGFESAMRGKALELEWHGNYVTPAVLTHPTLSLELAKKSVFLQTELFAPSVAIMGVKSIEDAVAHVNSTQYGLVASVFTQSKEIYRYCAQEIEAGQVNWNRPTVGASSRLPFGGLKKSGNHFPTALTSPRYCTFPMAALETEKPEAGPGTYVGLNWTA